MSRLTTWQPRSGIGIWSLLGAEAAEAVSHVPVGWICIDGQHGLHDDRSMRVALHAIDGTDVLVRVPEFGAGAVGRALDAGARGVIVPMIETAAQAAAVAAATRYPGQGTRSWGPFAEYWGRSEIATATANGEVVCVVMIETLRGLENAEEIAAVPGVDAILVGPYDLSLSLGTTLERLLHDGDALRRIAEACARHDVIPAAYAGSQERARRLRELGYELLAVATDRQLILDGAARALAQLSENAEAGRAR
jgi:4-hydroxy-2-oxoheptanedioate aldolase